jgi:hypothetical protein
MANTNADRYEDTEKNVPLQVDDVATSVKDLKAQSAILVRSRKQIQQRSPWCASLTCE